ncbi:hypothetical protein N0V83_003682 [Neocucurbitaria cava]|uniref:Uncharacterized protein n=1 Tax=Neocucurbitaria cava TaxID=798079 RepID=A0A9W8YC94_9PLEO|nr:hypothetical protein N0V83_003682 [Neocucurbitaria cava]
MLIKRASSPANARSASLTALFTSLSLTYLNLQPIVITRSLRLRFLFLLQTIIMSTTPSPIVASEPTSTVLDTTAASSAGNEVEVEDLVQDPRTDIAKNEFLEKLVVGVAGRVRHQTIYIRTPNNKRSKDQYKPEVDAPVPGRTLSILATSAEKEGRHDTQPFLVVGIVLARNPMKYSDKGTGRGGRNAEKSKARDARGTLPAESNILRAVVPITEYISQASVKYYIACNEVHGLCGLRTIVGDAIFFFEEIWTDIPSGADVKQRRSLLGSACKTLASMNKTPDPRAVTTIKNSKDPTASNDLSVTRHANAANLLLMQYSIFHLGKERSDIEAMMQTVKNILPDIEKKPSNEGTAAFFVFTEALEESDAKKLIAEVMVCTMSHAHSTSAANVFTVHISENLLTRC